MRTKLIAFAVLASGAAVSTVAQPVIQAVPERPRIIVDGYGEVKSPPNVAVITYIVRGEGTRSDDAVRAMTASGAGIESALRSVDASAEPRTGDVKVTPTRSDDCKEQEYNSPQLSTGPCAILGYVATQSVTVRTAAVKDAGTMVGLVGRGGAFDAQINSFGLSDPRTAQRQATAAALSDAALKASAVASAGNLPLGRILSVNTSTRDSGQDIVVAGSRAYDNAPPAPVLPPVVVRLTPELITTSANLTVTYAIGQ